MKDTLAFHAPWLSAYFHLHPWDTKRLNLLQVHRYFEWYAERVSKDG